MQHIQQNKTSNSISIKSLVRQITRENSTAINPRLVQAAINFSMNSENARTLAGCLIDAIDNKASHSFAVYKCLFVIEACLQNDTNKSQPFYQIMRTFAPDIRLITVLSFEGKSCQLRPQIHRTALSIYNYLVHSRPIRAEEFEAAVQQTFHRPLVAAPSDSQNDAQEDNSDSENDIWGGNNSPSSESHENSSADQQAGGVFDMLSENEIFVNPSQPNKPTFQQQANPFNNQPSFAKVGNPPNIQNSQNRNGVQTQNKNDIFDIFSKAPPQNPSVINPNPSTINQNPSTINQNPSAINQNPSTINQNPSAINQNPSAMIQNPYSVPQDKNQQSPANSMSDSFVFNQDKFTQSNPFIQQSQSNDPFLNQQNQQKQVENPFIQQNNSNNVQNSDYPFNNSNKSNNFSDFNNFNDLSKRPVFQNPSDDPFSTINCGAPVQKVKNDDPFAKLSENLASSKNEDNMNPFEQSQKSTEKINYSILNYTKAEIDAVFANQTPSISDPFYDIPTDHFSHAS
ncbi:hypothetical protein TRFO_25501 [Tritrichomonas foetus]|uniref:ENTH domain-containing protein n=1 Tax=Tritrichomonas foetus TaxID=1144522 RepID=A0A1J4K4U5_9EUKA|nr:hypothetical protein TRFO_25501 [Tritrichomonas foetus]|eukprot:OHT06473.1 hypothetical protein TRFO_25501 [Tritrichomonas foetus]